jgi:hypothetical protein
MILMIGTEKINVSLSLEGQNFDVGTGTGGNKQLGRHCQRMWYLNREQELHKKDPG